jgi:hypothetical protein
MPRSASFVFHLPSGIIPTSNKRRAAHQESLAVKLDVGSFVHNIRQVVLGSTYFIVKKSSILHVEHQKRLTTLPLTDLLRGVSGRGCA